MRHTLTLLFLSVCLGGFSQAQGTILIVPFDGLMYRSVVDCELAKGTNFRSVEIMQQVRDKLTRSLMLEMGRTWKVREASIHDSIQAHDLLDYMHGNVSYEYIPLISETDESEKKGASPLLNKIRIGKVSSQPEPGARIERGEVVAITDDREKFMNTVLLNPSLPAKLSESLSVSSLFFVNQLDIEMAPTGGTTNDRKLVIHFTWMDDSGKVIQAGKLVHEYASIDRSLKHMLEKHIPALAQTLAEKLSFAMAQQE